MRGPARPTPRNRKRRGSSSGPPRRLRFRSPEQARSQGRCFKFNHYRNLPHARSRSKTERMPAFHFLAQPAPTDAGPNAATVFYITLLFIFLTAIITTVVTKWARDKCLKFFNGYHVTL